MQDYLQHLLQLSRLQYQLNALELKLYSPDQHDACFRRQAARTHERKEAIPNVHVGALKTKDEGDSHKAPVTVNKSASNHMEPSNDSNTPAHQEADPLKSTVNLIPIASNRRRKRPARHAALKAATKKQEQGKPGETPAKIIQSSMGVAPKPAVAPLPKIQSEPDKQLLSVDQNETKQRPSDNQTNQNSRATENLISETPQNRQPRTETLRPKPIHEDVERPITETRTAIEPKPIPEIHEQPHTEIQSAMEPKPIPEIREQPRTEIQQTMEPRPIPEGLEQISEEIIQEAEPIPEDVEPIREESYREPLPVPEDVGAIHVETNREPLPVPEDTESKSDETQTGSHTRDEEIPSITELPVSVPSEAELLKNFEGPDTLFLDDLSAMLSDIQDDPSELPSPLLLDPELDDFPEIIPKEPKEPIKNDRPHVSEDDQKFLESDEVMLQMLPGQIKNLHENIDALTDALDQMPENMSLWLARAKAWKRDGDLAAAISDCYRALQLSGEDLEILSLLEELLTEANIPQYRSILLPSK